MKHQPAKPGSPPGGKDRRLMRKNSAGPETESTTPRWECLEAMVREKAQELIQQVLEEEVSELLGRRKAERREAVDPSSGYRNGCGKPRR